MSQEKTRRNVAKRLLESRHCVLTLIDLATPDALWRANFDAAIINNNVGALPRLPGLWRPVVLSTVETKSFAAICGPRSRRSPEPGNQLNERP